MRQWQSDFVVFGPLILVVSHQAHNNNRLFCATPAVLPASDLIC